MSTKMTAKLGTLRESLPTYRTSVTLLCKTVLTSRVCLKVFIMSVGLILLLTVTSVKSRIVTVTDPNERAG